MREKRLNMQQRNKTFAVLLLLPSVVFIFAFFAYPVCYSVYLSFTNTNLFLPSVQQGFIGLNNYIKLFQDPDFIDSIRVTFVFVFGATIIKIIVGILLALLYQQHIRGFGIFRSIIVIPMMITPICAGLIMKVFLQPGFGVMNYLIGFLGIPRIGWYAEVNTALMSVMISDLWMMIPFVIVVAMSGFASLPEEVFEAADIDGASWWTKLIKITLPMMKPIIAVIVLINLIDGFKVFDNVYIMTKGGPAHATELFTIFAYKEALKMGKLGYGATASLIVLFIIFVIALIFLKVSGAEEEFK